MLTRRQLIKTGAVGGAMLLAPWQLRAAWGDAAGLLDPAALPKYVSPLVVPPAMPVTTNVRNRSTDYYVIAVRQFRQQILPPGWPGTTVWGYGSLSSKGTFNYPAFTIEARVGRPVRVKWVNDLVDGAGNFLPHLLPVDPTLHWANPPGGEAGRDMAPDFASTPGPYTGPVPIVTHLHGGHSAPESDGYPEAWYLPAAVNLPAGYAQVGSFYDRYRASFESTHDTVWDPGSATFQYGNDQPAATLWVHDHALGITRLNVYAGPAGFYLLRGGPTDLPAGALPGPAPGRGDRPGIRYHEIPLAIQDRSFRPDGSLSYPDSRRFFDEFAGPYVPYSDIAPIWNPEVFGNTTVVNGRTWPVFQVEPRRYRLRLLNGCNSRFLILKIVADPMAPRPATPAVPFWQVGSDSGFLSSPVLLEQLLLGNGERADVVVDLTGIPEGTALYMINEGPDEPFGGGQAGVDFPAADPATTGQVMKLVVGSLAGPDTSVPPDQLTLPTLPVTGPATVTRQLSLNELDSAVLPDVGPRMALLGTLAAGAEPVPLGWGDPVTERPALGTTEVWEISNFTADAHPIHLHQVQFEVVGRQAFDGPVRAPEPWETGPKDTVVAFPGETTRVRSRFDLPGRYVWHCHILEHEDHEMMRPFEVVA